jgi:Fic family protein
VRELDVLARTTRGAKPVVRSLLATESLPSGTILCLADGQAVAATPETDRRALRFEQACHDGARARVLDRDLLLRTNRRLVAGGRGGALRTRPMRVGVAFLAPPAAALDGLVDDLVAFLARTDLCPVAQALVAYARLEHVHPFVDGNGRVGRWLVQVVLRRRGVARVLVPPIGLVLAANPAGLFPAHRAFREGDIDAWCTFAAAALTTAATRATALLAPT